MEAEDMKAHSPQDDRNKRKMKTPLQLETLEKVFAEEKYPSEAIRARLSQQLGLSDRQLKMWFCHRRLKERKSRDDDEPAIPTAKKPPAAVIPNLSPASERMSTFPYKEGQRYGGSSYSIDKRGVGEHLKDYDSIRRKRKRNVVLECVDPQRAAELQAIAAVEAQLGEPVREDGPVLGVEFDVLPPGAFGSPIVTKQHQKRVPFQESESYTAVIKDHIDSAYDSPAHKGSRRRRKPASPARQAIHRPATSRVVQEYQFIPEQPTGRDRISPAYERLDHSKAFLGIDNPLQALTSHGSFIGGRESLANVYALQGILPNASPGLLFQLDSHSNHLFSHSRMDLGSLQKNSFSCFSHDNLFGNHSGSYQMLAPGLSIHDAENQSLIKEQEATRLDRKRKNEEERIAKEVEAHKKRIKRELEQQEIARRKREEQLQKEKRKELERMVREKQREDERIQREQRREYERRERLLQKENQRLAREREKEESRRLKEAAKLKAALERATARRLARESTELIDDERLELLEAAAKSQGLPSIYLLDAETLQGLDRYKDVLKRFPPSVVKTKQPVTVRPWIESAQKLGNLFMVWRFLTTFADVLGLWPFTIDELVQAFHDFDPRLLNEIHISLLRTLVKDVEDVARAASSGGGANQYTAASVIGGGHSQLVEAAFSWGFDIRDWSQHLTSLTWPEILRQFSLAGGYGPRWIKQQVKVVDSCTKVEGNDGKEAVKTLRSGVAASHAVTLMKGKGASTQRGSRHRLTPGTVKYAAFHVLSVEGAKGLSIPEVADRIQKYGLRDFSRTKTPEASITAALSRDTYFFERVAPSTYCVKPAFRKDPDDAEKLLQAALERTRLFQCRVSDGDDVEKDTEDIDEPDKDDYDDDLEDIDASDVQEFTDDRKPPCSQKEDTIAESEDNFGKSKRLPSFRYDRDSACEGNHDSVSNTHSVSRVMENESKGFLQPKQVAITSTDAMIDEDHPGESWVQGLLVGEYSDLSVEERLNALVALIEAVNEGNTIRLALEERMEAASALKRQMWAEAQLDKRRSKEEQLTKPQGHLGEAVDIEGSKLSPSDGDEKPNDQKLHLESLAGGQMVDENDLSNTLPEKGSGSQGYNSQNAFSHTNTTAFMSEKTRAQMKMEIDLRADSLYVYRSLPLGFDRRHNRYWQFVTCTGSEDPGCGRIYLESSEDGHWEVIDTEEGFNTLMSNLDTRGIREAHLHSVLQKLENPIRQGMRRSGFTSDAVCAVDLEQKVADPIRSIGVTSVRLKGSHRDCTVLSEDDKGAIQIQNPQADKCHVLEGYIELDQWLWSKHTPDLADINGLRQSKKRCLDVLAKCKSCHELYWPQERHCPHCHTLFDGRPKTENKFSQHVVECEARHKKTTKLHCLAASVPPRIQLLKAQIIAVEAAIPSEALKPFWTESYRKAWATKLKQASSAAELLRVCTELEYGVLREWLSASFETSEELSKAAWSDRPANSDVLPWIPQTTAAVALHLKALDTAIYYTIEQKKQSSMEPCLKHLDTAMNNAERNQKVDNKESSFAVSKMDSASAGSGGGPQLHSAHEKNASGVSSPSGQMPKVPQGKTKFSGANPKETMSKAGSGGRLNAHMDDLKSAVRSNRGHRSERRKQPYLQKQGGAKDKVPLLDRSSVKHEHHLLEENQRNKARVWEAQESSDDDLMNDRVNQNEDDAAGEAEEEDTTDQEQNVDEYEDNDQEHVDEYEDNDPSDELEEVDIHAGDGEEGDEYSVEDDDQEDEIGEAGHDAYSDDQEDDLDDTDDNANAGGIDNGSSVSFSSDESE